MSKITVLEDYNKTISKTILNKELDTAANGHICKGKGTTLDIDLHELKIVIETLGDKRCLCLCVHKDGSYEMDISDSSKISRKKVFFSYPEGPSFMLFDFDKIPKSMSIQDALNALYKYSPALKGCGYLCVPSCSSYLYADTGEQLSGGKSFHIYFEVSNGSKIQELGDILFKKSVIDGFGSIKVIKRSGGTSTKSLFDPVVWRETNREIFEANPICCEGVNSKRLDNIIEFDGPAVDIDKAIELASFSEEDRLLYKSICKKLREDPAVLEEIKREKLAGVEYRVNKRVQKKGTSKISESKKKVNSDDWYDNSGNYHTFLTSRDFIMKEDGGEIEVREILQDAFHNFGGEWNNASMPDPINPYKRGNEAQGIPGKGIAYVRIEESGAARIFSYYHYIEYHLVWDVESIIEEIKLIKDLDILDAFIDHIFSTDGIISSITDSETESIAKCFKDATKEFKSTSKHGEDLRTLKSQFKAKVIEANNAIGSSFVETASFIDEINAVHGVVMVGGKFRVVSECYESDEWKTEYRAFEDVANYNAEMKIFIGNKSLNAFRIWNESPKKNKFESVVFEPRNDIIIRPGGKKVIQQGGKYNLWQGFVADMSRATNCEKILWHIKHIWCSGDEEMNQFVLTWISKIFQEPWRTNMPFLVLGSEQGSGKGLIIDQVIVSLLGAHGVSVTNKDQVIGRFNSLMGANVFTFFDETFFSGDHEAASALKSFVNGKRIIERKGIEPMRTDNFTKGILASNADYVTKLDLKERRFVYPNVSNEMTNNKEYFDALGHEVENGGKEAFLDYMLKFESDVDVSANNIERLNHSPQRYRDKINSAHPIIQMFVHIFMYGFGQLIKNSSLNATDVLKWEKEAYPLKMTKEQVMELFEIYCNQNKIQYKYFAGSAFHNLGKLEGLYANHNKSIEARDKSAISVEGYHPHRILEMKPKLRCYSILKLDQLEDM